MTWPKRIDPARSIARHSRVYSSITARHFNCWPLRARRIRSRTPRHAVRRSQAVAGGDGQTRVDGVACVAPVTRQDATAERMLALPAPAHPARPVSIRNAAPIGRPTSARTHVAPKGHRLRVRDLLASGRHVHYFYALISLITSSSRSRSPTIFFSLAFSCSSYLSRVTSVASRRPKCCRRE